MQNQIRMVQVQKDAQTNQTTAEAMAKAELYKALAQVAMANPEQASAVTVALAVQGLGEESTRNNSPLINLQPLQNEGLEFAKAFAAPLANVTTAVATAYINADVAKTQSDNAAAVQINDALQDSRIAEAIANVGIAAAETSGMFVSGDNYTVTDEGSISQDSFSSMETTNTTTTTTTETNTSSSIADSYNTQNETTNTTTNTTENADSYNTTDMSITDDNRVVTYGDQQMTLTDLLTFLNNSGESYAITLGDQTYTDTDQSDEAQTCVPTWTGYVCTGG